MAIEAIPKSRVHSFLVTITWGNRSPSLVVVIQGKIRLPEGFKRGDLRCGGQFAECPAGRGMFTRGK